MIINPNTCGQGYDSDHLANPYHKSIVDCGYTYSHSTPIRGMDGASFIHHTYKHGKHNVSVEYRNGRWAWQTSTSCASGHKWIGRIGAGGESLMSHLANKRRRYPELRRHNAAISSQ